MSILIDKDTRVITQGMTGKVGQFHTFHCRKLCEWCELFRGGRESEKGGRIFRGDPGLRFGARRQSRQPARRCR